MIFARKPQWFVCSLPPLYVNNVILELVMHYKYVGVILKSNLFWCPHIQAFCSKARKVMGFIYHTFFKQCTCMFQSLVKLYVSFVLPYLTYCSSVWDPLPHSINLIHICPAQSSCPDKERMIQCDCHNQYLCVTLVRLCITPNQGLVSLPDYEWLATHTAQWCLGVGLLSHIYVYCAYWYLGVPFLYGIF